MHDLARIIRIILVKVVLFWAVVHNRVLVEKPNRQLDSTSYLIILPNQRFIWIYSWESENMVCAGINNKIPSNVPIDWLVGESNVTSVWLLRQCCVFIIYGCVTKQHKYFIGLIRSMRSMFSMSYTRIINNTFRQQNSTWNSISQRDICFDSSTFRRAS